MKTLIIKSLLPSLCQREEMYPSLSKRGKGKFFNNDALLMISLVIMLNAFKEFLSTKERLPEKNIHYYIKGLVTL